KKVLSDGKTSRGRASSPVDRNRTSDGKDDKKGDKNGGSKESKYPKPIPPVPVEDMTEKEKKKWDRVMKRWERKVEREKRRKDKVHPVVGFGARMLMTVRNVSGTYALNDGTLLPGYNQETRIL